MPLNPHPPEVAVLLPAHGDCPYLSEALASILEDASPRLTEILIVLDRVSAATRTLLSAVPDARVRLVPSSGDGLVAALNTGLGVTQAEYIARMDADDVMLPGRIEAQARYLDEHPRVAVVGGQVQFIDALGALGKVSKFPESSKAVLQELSSSRALAHPAVMYRRKLVLEAGGYRSQFRHAEDFDLWLRMTRFGEISNLHQTVLLYRTHDDQVSRLHLLEQRAAALRASESHIWERYPKNANPLIALVRKLVLARARTWSRFDAARSAHQVEKSLLLGVRLLLLSPRRLVKRSLLASQR